MFGTKTVAGPVKINVGRMVVKIIPEKIKKKAEITTTFNISPGGDIPTTGGANRGEGGRRRGLTACFSSILSLGK